MSDNGTVAVIYYGYDRDWPFRKFYRKGASTETKERKNVQSGGGGNNFDGYKLRDVENVR